MGNFTTLSIYVYIYTHTIYIYIASNDSSVNEIGIGKDFEGTDPDVIKVLSQNFRRGIERKISISVDGHPVDIRPRSSQIHV